LKPSQCKKALNEESADTLGVSNREHQALLSAYREGIRRAAFGSTPSRQPARGSSWSTGTSTGTVPDGKQLLTA